MTRVVCPCCKGHKVLESFDPGGGAPHIDICTHCMGSGVVEIEIEDIDLSDIPEATEEWFRNAFRLPPGASARSSSSATTTTSRPRLAASPSPSRSRRSWSPGSTMLSMARRNLAAS
jgi:hypothetical protein